jgi:hypothetical protein
MTLSYAHLLCALLHCQPLGQDVFNACLLHLIASPDLSILAMNVLQWCVGAGLQCQ